MSENKDEAIASGTHSVLALNKMKSLRENSTLCDVVLVVGTAEIPAHKVVLAACSPYFEFMFTSSKIEESSKDRIEIKGLCPKSFSTLLDFIYSGYLSVDEETIEDLLHVADFLKVATAKEQCLNYMQKHINVSNCVRIRNIAKKHFFLELEKKVSDFISCNFIKAIESEGFFKLNLEEVKNFITDESFYCDDSFCEKAISSWIDYDKSGREDFKESISQIVRVYIESKRLKELSLYNTSRNRRIFCFYNDQPFSYALDLNNMSWYCVSLGPKFKYNRPVFHDNLICLVSTDEYECGIYNLKEEKWSTSVMPLKNLYSGVCSDHNRIHLTTSNSKATFSYDVVKNALYVEPSLMYERSSPAVTFNENCIYVLGGAHRTAEFRDIRTKDWRAICYMPYEAENISACSLQGKVYCSFPADSRTGSTGGFYQYDKYKGVWIRKSAVPNGSNRFVIGSTDEAVYAHSGNGLYRYNLNNDEWICLDSVIPISDFVCVYPR